MKKSLSRSALSFVVSIGLGNLFADMTYEGGASINGQFLETLGATALIVSVASGTGEFLGYLLRPLAGYLADRTGRYWIVMLLGYSINVLAVPALFFVGSWQAAVVFILLERIGRAIRKPPTEALLSYTAGKLGRGRAFALNTALDETGAALGPFVASAILFLGGNYRTAYALFLISAVLAMTAFISARIRYPAPARFEQVPLEHGKKFSRAYWILMVAGILFGAGFISYELIPFHLAATGKIDLRLIPALLGFSTACAVLTNLIFSKVYDQKPVRTVVSAVAISAFFAPLIFIAGTPFLFVAMVVWGISYATQDTLLSATIAGMLPSKKRGQAFGLFYIGYGGGTLLGSLASGWLYTQQVSFAAAFAFGVQILSIPFFVWALRSVKQTDRLTSAKNKPTS